MNHNFFGQDNRDVKLSTLFVLKPVKAHIATEINWFTQQPSEVLIILCSAFSFFFKAEE